MPQSSPSGRGRSRRRPSVELPWEDEDELTSVTAPSSKVEVITHSCLVLAYDGLQGRAGQDWPHVKLGRSPENDLPVNGRLTFWHGRFHLRDASTNGTAVIHPNGDVNRLHLEEIALAETGTINLGGTSVNDPAAEVRFRCE